MNPAAKTRRKNKREEAQLETEMHRGAEFLEFIRIPIPDSVPLKGPNGERMGQTPRIYDLALFRDGIIHGIELKQTGTQTLKQSAFKEHQLPQLAKVYRRGGIGWVGCVFHDTETRFREVWFAFSEHARKAFEGGLDSLSIDWFRRWGVQLPKIMAPVVDPKTFDVKINDDGSETNKKRAWDFRPAHEAALGFLGRKKVAR